jgi:hypothetical protein
MADINADAHPQQMASVRVVTNRLLVLFSEPWELLGRPPAVGDALRINERRASGASWRAIGRELGLSGETAKKNRANVAKKYAQLQLIGSD